MESKHVEHLTRVRHLRESFAEANERLVARLRRVDDHAAEGHSAAGGWSAAQIGWHVAKVSTRFASLISGEFPGAQPLPDGFRPREWTAIAAEIPAKLQAPSGVEPPAVVHRGDAIAALEASGVRMARAFDALTPERGEHLGITSTVVGGTITLYQLGEWATAHVIRHNRQAKRVLGEG
jgi:DinB superfamily